MHAHPDAYTFTNVLTHLRTQARMHTHTHNLYCSHDLHYSLSSCRQTAAVAINDSQPSVVCVSGFLFPRAHCRRVSVGGVWWRVGCSDTDNISLISRASMLHCSPDSITCVLCFHELITGTLEAWQEHGDHALMEV